MPRIWSASPRSPSVWNVSATRGAVVGPVATNSPGPAGLVVVVVAAVTGGAVAVPGVEGSVVRARGFDAPRSEPHAAASRAMAEPVRNRRRSMYLGCLGMRAPAYGRVRSSDQRPAVSLRPGA